MATLYQNAAAVKAAQEEIDQAIVDRGGTTAGGLVNAAEAIRSIPGGEVTYSWDGRLAELGWPDIKAILDSDDDPHAGKFIILLDATSPSIQLKMAAKYVTSDGGVYSSDTTHFWDQTQDIVCKTGQHVRWVKYYFDTSRPVTSSPTSSLWNDDGKGVLWYYGSAGTMIQEGKDHWKTSGIGIVRFDGGVTSTTPSGYFNTCYVVESVRLTLEKNFQGVFGSCTSLKEADLTITSPNAFHTHTGLFTNCYNLERAEVTADMSEVNTRRLTHAFENCSSLHELDLHIARIDLVTEATNMFMASGIPSIGPDLQLVLSSCTFGGNMFSGCRSLLRVDDSFVTTNMASVASMFSNCAVLQEVPDELDLSHVNPGGTNTMFNGCYSLRRLPTHVTCNVDLSFGHCPLVSRDSVATFDGDGKVNGGFVGNINTRPGDSAATVVFSRITQSLFSTAEWDEIKATLLAKNWNCAVA